MTRNTQIISAFPACGKTYICNAKEFQRLRCADSDSSEFSWIRRMVPGLGGGEVKERNPEFPWNYIKHLTALYQSGKYDFIFISSHDVVLDELDHLCIEYGLVYPKMDQLFEWIARCEERGNTEKFIANLKTNWSKWISRMEHRSVTGAKWCYALDEHGTLVTALLEKEFIKYKEDEKGYVMKL